MNSTDRGDLLQGTLDLLILQTLQLGEAHGHAIGRHIQQVSADVLRVETGSLYPALHRLEAQRWIASSWRTSDRGKRARFYRLTPAGRRQLVAERSRWDQLAGAIALVLNSPSQESA